MPLPFMHVEPSFSLELGSVFFWVSKKEQRDINSLICIPWKLFFQACDFFENVFPFNLLASIPTTENFPKPSLLTSNSGPLSKPITDDSLITPANVVPPSPSPVSLSTSPHVTRQSTRNRTTPRYLQDCHCNL